MMAGLARIAKMYGCMRINGKLFVWDYAADCAVPEAEMKPGSDRWLFGFECGTVPWDCFNGCAPPLWKRSCGAP